MSRPSWPVAPVTTIDMNFSTGGAVGGQGRTARPRHLPHSWVPTSKWGTHLEGEYDDHDAARDLQADTACPAPGLLVEHVTSKWGVLVLLALDDRTMRWSELKREIDGVSEKMLIQTLQTLEADGLVLRTARPVVPPHVEYTLTDAGHAAAGAAGAAGHWAFHRAQA